MKKFSIFRIVFSKHIPITVTWVILFMSLLSTVNAQAVTPELQQQIEDSQSALLNDNSQFQQGRDVLNQAWNALDNNDKAAAIYYFETAEKYFSSALMGNAEDIPILMNRATAYLGLNKYDLALQDFDRVLDINSTYLPAYDGKVLVYQVMGNIEKSKEILTNKLLSGKKLSGKADPTPSGIYYSTWYGSTTKHNYTNRFTGQTTVNADGFGCGVTQPWKTNVENAVYFYLPWITWNRNTQGMRYGLTGVPLGWQSLNGNTQGYTNASPFLGWSVPNGENYVLLIAETDVCLGAYLPGGSRYRISAYSNY